MKKTRVGPKLLFKLNQMGHPDSEDIEEEIYYNEPFSAYLGCNYNDKLRYDSKGRLIGKQKNHSIDFENNVTVLVYDPQIEVQQIKETISLFSSNDSRKQIHSNQSIGDDHKISPLALKSILKSNKQTNSNYILLKQSFNNQYL